MSKKLLPIAAVVGTVAVLVCFAAPHLGLSQVAQQTQAVATAIVPPDASIADWGTWLQTLGGLKGMGLSAIIAVVVQGLMLLSRTKLSSGQKLAGVTGLTVGLGTPILTALTGIGLPHAIANMAVLAATQVFAHQVKKTTAGPA